MQSLLGQFYNRIKGSQEDIASEGLTYILKNSIGARKTLNQIIEINSGFRFSDLTFTTQNVGEKLERPDICGNDENGKEVLIIEAKFWASLTHNQPNGYLERLSNNTILMFLVPTLRIRNVFEEVVNRINEIYSECEIDIENQKIKILTTGQIIIFKSWNEILNSIKSKLIEEQNQTLISDIDQIIGFCETIDTNSFQPISDEDLSPKIAKKINSYFDVVDKVVDELKNRNSEISGLRRQPQLYGYYKYFQIENFGFAMCVKMDIWSEFADTPFWFSIKDDISEKKIWNTTELFKRKCEKIALLFNHKYVEKNKEIFFGLKPKIDETEDIVVNNLAYQIEKLVKTLNE